MADNKNNAGAAIAGGVIGAIIGAAGGAVAVALSDEKNRKKVEKLIDEMKVKGEKALKDLQKTAGELEKGAAHQINAAAKKAEDLTEEVKPKKSKSK